MRRIFAKTYLAIDRGAGTLGGLIEDSDFTSSERQKLQQAWAKQKALLQFDKLQKQELSPHLAGVDEVGRGPLAGPLVAACFVGPNRTDVKLPFLRDSKQLSPSEREALVPRIQEIAMTIGYGVVDPEEFDQGLNLHHLTFLAMQRAVDQALDNSTDFGLLVDGRYPLPHWLGPQRAVIKGDDKSFSIACASILAKVFRDRMMHEAHSLYPQYGFDRNAGYGTLEHRTAIQEFGPCPLHRQGFLSRLRTPKGFTRD